MKLKVTQHTGVAPLHSVPSQVTLPGFEGEPPSTVLPLLLPPSLPLDPLDEAPEEDAPEDDPPEDVDAPLDPPPLLEPPPSLSPMTAASSDPHPPRDANARAELVPSKHATQAM